MGCMGGNSRGSFIVYSKKNESGGTNRRFLRKLRGVKALSDKKHLRTMCIKSDKILRSLYGLRHRESDIIREGCEAMEIRICAFLSANEEGIELGQTEKVGECLGQLLKGLERDMGVKCIFVYGGNEKGAMGSLAHAVEKQGIAVEGVTVDILEGIEEFRNDIKITKTEGFDARLQTMLYMSDAFLFLPGGIGTLYELVGLIGSGLVDHANKPAFIFNPPLEKQGFDSKDVYADVLFTAAGDGAKKEIIRECSMGKLKNTMISPGIFTGILLHLKCTNLTGLLRADVSEYEEKKIFECKDIDSLVIHADRELRRVIEERKKTQLDVIDEPMNAI